MYLKEGGERCHWMYHTKPGTGPHTHSQETPNLHPPLSTCCPCWDIRMRKVAVSHLISQPDWYTHLLCVFGRWRVCCSAFVCVWALELFSAHACTICYSDGHPSSYFSTIISSCQLLLIFTAVDHPICSFCLLSHVWGPARPWCATLPALSHQHPSWHWAG